MVMIARRDIEKGEELSFFYPSTEWEMQAPFICLCGAANCIHVVAGARFLPLSTLEHHYPVSYTHLAVGSITTFLLFDEYRIAPY